MFHVKHAEQLVRIGRLPWSDEASTAFPKEAIQGSRKLWTDSLRSLRDSRLQPMVPQSEVVPRRFDKKTPEFLIQECVPLGSELSFPFSQAEDVPIT